jgi:hypothetical protein
MAVRCIEEAGSRNPSARSWHFDTSTYAASQLRRTLSAYGSGNGFCTFILSFAPAPTAIVLAPGALILHLMYPEHIAAHYH